MTASKASPLEPPLLAAVIAVPLVPPSKLFDSVTWTAPAAAPELALVPAAEPVTWWFVAEPVAAQADALALAADPVTR